MSSNTPPHTGSASASSELDSILDSLQALQHDLDVCLKQQDQLPQGNRPATTRDPHHSQHQQQQHQQLLLLPEVPEADEESGSRDDDGFPPPPSPNQLSQTNQPTILSQQKQQQPHQQLAEPPAALSRGSPSAICDAVSSDSGIQAESPPSNRRTVAAAVVAASSSASVGKKNLQQKPFGRSASEQSPTAATGTSESRQAMLRKQISTQETPKSGSNTQATISQSPGAVETASSDMEESVLPSLLSVMRPGQQQSQPQLPQQQKQQKKQKQPLQKLAKQQSPPQQPESPAPFEVSTGSGDFFLSSMSERIRVMDHLFNKTYLTRMAVRIHCLDRTTKMLALDERSKTGLVCTMMANKSLTDRRIGHSIVEKLPDMKMERIIEDHELLGDTLLAWPANSKNLLFFEDREEKFGALTNPDVYLGPAFAREPGETAQQQLSRVVNDLFEGEGTAPPMKEQLHFRLAGTKSWKKRLCVLRSSGIYAVKKGKSDLKCIASLAGFHLFTTLGGWTSKGKIEAPTPHGFALKALQTHSLQSKQIHFFAATSEASMKRWCTALRVAMHGNQYYLSYLFAHQSANAK